MFTIKCDRLDILETEMCARARGSLRGLSRFLDTQDILETEMCVRAREGWRGLSRFG